MTAVTPFLWFDDDLSDALDLYGELFDDAVVHSRQEGPDGKLFGAEFEVGGQRFSAMNAGPQHPHTPAFSMFTVVDGQGEVDRLWEALTADGGEPGNCGWLKDRFGLSWQIVPQQFLDLMSSGDGAQSQRVMGAMMQMHKMDVAALQGAADAT